MTDILFVNPPVPGPPQERTYSTYAPPLGIGYLASILMRDGFSVAVAELAVSDDPFADLTTAMAEHMPRIVGFYTSTVSYRITERLVATVRALDADAIVWTGGPHVSYEYETALQESGFDVVFLFEAEQSALEAARAQLRGEGRLDDIAGIAFLENGRCIRTAPRAREKVLDRYPYPARELFPMEKYIRPGTIMSSRGCPLKCIFCIASTFEDSYRYRSPADVVGEVKEMHARWGINDFYFTDNVFTTHRPRAREICRLLREADLPIGWYCVSRVDYAAPVLMQDLASAGCYRIELGVESGDGAVLDSLRKRIRIDQVRRAADIILNLGMQPMFTFQVGHPSDTLDSIEATLNLAQELRDMGAGTYLAVTTPYPGSPLMMDRDKYGIRIEAEDWEEYRWSNPIYSTCNFTRNDIRRAVYRDAERVTSDMAAGKIRDPRSAPWFRFDGGPPVPLPPPPAGPEDDAPLSIGERHVDAPAAELALPLLQISR